ncbi:DUF2891 domain-containing protein [Altererythrobacter sp.]|nr:DUF2891 domain-containing protein [Altererythrobacter sp.]
MALSEQTAQLFARTALGHVSREYPNKLDHVMAGDVDVRSPRSLHPCFFGSFDWHSCVHSWWTLLTVRRLFPDCEEARQIDRLAESTFTPEKLSAELAYLHRPEARGFERPYGWGWLLYLHHEAARHKDRHWADRMEPLSQAIAQRFLDYLPLLTYPVTVGTHYNTAFALALAHPWAEQRNATLAGAIERWTEHTFAHRTDYRGWEPGGDEFLSPVLTASLLMGRTSRREAFIPWFEKLVIGNGWLERNRFPVAVSDRSDGKIAHLDGLNLSRAWCLREISAKMSPHPEAEWMGLIADEHFAQAAPQVTGDYMGEHWLASFALLALLAG